MASSVTQILADLAALKTSVDFALVKSAADLGGLPAPVVPVAPKLPESAAGTTLTAGGPIVDRRGLLWSLVGAAGAGQVALGGVIDATTSAVSALYYDGKGGVFQTSPNASSFGKPGWWQAKDGGGWTDAQNPTVATPVAGKPVTTPAPAPSQSLAAPVGNQVNLNVGSLGKSFPVGVYGAARSMGANSWSYPDASDAAFLSVANQYPVPSLRHNWELNTMANFVWSSRGVSADFSRIDNWLNNASRFATWFGPGKLHKLSVGWPSWMNAEDAGDQAWYGQACVAVAQHFSAKGLPLTHMEASNEPDGHVSTAGMIGCTIAMAKALKTWNPAMKVGGLALSWYQSGTYKTWVKAMSDAGVPADFISFHQYVTGNRTDKSAQQCVNDSMGMAATMRLARSELIGLGLPVGIEMMCSEYNADGGDYSDPMNGNMIGAIAAACATTSCAMAGVGATMCSAWDVCDDGSYQMYGHQGAYGINPVGRILSKLGQAMAGILIDTPVGPNVGPVMAAGVVNNGKPTLLLLNPDLGAAHVVQVQGMSGLINVYEQSQVAPASLTRTVDASALSSLSVPAGGMLLLS